MTGRTPQTNLRCIRTVLNGNIYEVLLILNTNHKWLTADSHIHTLKSQKTKTLPVNTINKYNKTERCIILNVHKP